MKSYQQKKDIFQLLQMMTQIQQIIIKYSIFICVISFLFWMPVLYLGYNLIIWHQILYPGCQ